MWFVNAITQFIFLAGIGILGSIAGMGIVDRFRTARSKRLEHPAP